MGRVNQNTPLGTFALTGQTLMIKSAAFRNQAITLVTTGFSGTINFYASNSNEVGTAPDLSASASATNQYSVVRAINLQTGDPIDGATGVPFTTNTSITRYEMNDNGPAWVGVKIVRTAGSVQIDLKLTDNQ